MAGATHFPQEHLYLTHRNRISNATATTGRPSRCRGRPTRIRMPHTSRKFNKGRAKGGDTSCFESFASASDERESNSRDSSSRVVQAAGRRRDGAISLCGQETAAVLVLWRHEICRSLNALAHVAAWRWVWKAGSSSQSQAVK